MKKLLLIALIFAVTASILISFSRDMGLSFRPMDLIQNGAVVFGWSMAAVGILALLLATAFTDGKQRIYQGAFCTLLGVAIASFSLPAFIAAIVVVAWLDYNGRSLN